MTAQRAWSVGIHRNLAGFGLIELMIAMVLSLIVMGAAFAVFMSNQNTFRANEGLNRIQESARVAFELMSRDIRAAGGSSCSNMSVIEGVVAPDWQTFNSQPVFSPSAGRLRVLSGDDAAYRIINSTASSVTLAATPGITTASDAFNDNDIVLLCNARKSFLVRVAGTPAGMVVSHTALPDGYNPMGDEFAPPAAVMMARYRNVEWFVAANGRGGNSLFVNRAGTNEEVAEGVQNIAFEYLRAGQNAYNAAPASWNDVIAVRITMTLQGADIDGQTLTRAASNVVSMRSRTL